MHQQRHRRNRCPRSSQFHSEIPNVSLKQEELREDKSQGVKVCRCIGVEQGFKLVADKINMIGMNTGELRSGITYAGPAW